MADKYLPSTLFISVVVLLYQGIVNSNLSIISQFSHQHGNDWSGPLSTALLFIGSGTCSLFNSYIGNHPYRCLLFLGSFGYIIFITMSLVSLKLAFSPLAIVLTMVGSLVAGIIASVLYNSEYNYQNCLARIDHQEVKYFGILLMFNQASYVSGNVLSALLIQPLGQFNYVLVMDVALLFISLLFLLTKDPDPQDLSPEPEELSESEAEEEAEDVDECLSWEPFRVCGYYAFTGIASAFIFNAISIIIYKTFESRMQSTELNHFSFIIFAVEGVG